MQKGLNILMFYAASLLSMKSNTDISLLYFVSTTKNIKRIRKKSLYNLNIQKLLTDLSNPPQPFALRLYSYLVVGVVRIYLFKLKTYENEVQNLLNLLNFRKTKDTTRNKKDINLNKKDTNKNTNKDISLLDDSSDINDIDKNNDIGISVLDYNNIDNDIDNDNDINIVPKRFKLSSLSKHIPTFDTITEFSNCSKFCLTSLPEMTKNNENNYENYQYNLLDYKIIREVFINDNKENNTIYNDNINNYTLIDDPFSNDLDFDPVEKMRSSSLMTYSSTVDNTIFKEENWEGKVFNTINIGGRLRRVVNFYVLLEKCSKGEVEAYQNEPFGDILLS